MPLYNFHSTVNGKFTTCAQCRNPSSDFVIPDYVLKRKFPADWDERVCPHCGATILIFKDGRCETFSFDMSDEIRKCNICTAVCIGDSALRNHMVNQHGGRVS